MLVHSLAKNGKQEKVGLCIRRPHMRDMLMTSQTWSTGQPPHNNNNNNNNGYLAQRLTRTGPKRLHVL